MLEMVESCVFPRSHKSQIRWVIVQLVPIFMMNNFFTTPFHFAAQHFLHYMDVLCFWFASNHAHSVSLAADPISTPPQVAVFPLEECVPAFARTEMAAILAVKAWADFKLFLTCGAFKLDSFALCETSALGRAADRQGPTAFTKKYFSAHRAVPGVDWSGPLKIFNDFWNRGHREILQDQESKVNDLFSKWTKKEITWKSY